MVPAGMSYTVAISDQRSYINIETLRGKNPTEIHRALSKVCGEFTVDDYVVRFLVGLIIFVVFVWAYQEGREHQKMKEI